MSHLNQEKKRHLQRYHPEVYEDIFPKKAKEVPAALGMALAGAGLTTAAEIVARAKELAAAAKGAVDEKEKNEEGKIIHGEVEVVLEGEVETKEDEAEGVNEEAEVDNQQSSREHSCVRIEGGRGPRDRMDGTAYDRVLLSTFCGNFWQAGEGVGDA